jgi:hypothetical protein
VVLTAHHKVPVIHNALALNVKYAATDAARGDSPCFLSGLFISSKTTRIDSRKDCSPDSGAPVDVLTFCHRFRLRSCRTGLTKSTTI